MNLCIWILYSCHLKWICSLCHPLLWSWNCILYRLNRTNLLFRYPSPIITLHPNKLTKLPTPVKSWKGLCLGPIKSRGLAIKAQWYPRSPAGIPHSFHVSIYLDTCLFLLPTNRTKEGEGKERNTRKEKENKKEERKEKDKAHIAWLLVKSTGRWKKKARDLYWNTVFHFILMSILWHFLFTRLTWLPESWYDILKFMYPESRKHKDQS